MCLTEDTTSRSQRAPVRPQLVMLASEDITVEFHCLRQLDSRDTHQVTEKESSTTERGSDNSNKIVSCRKSRAGHDGSTHNVHSGSSRGFPFQHKVESPSSGRRGLDDTSATIEHVSVVCTSSSRLTSRVRKPTALNSFCDVSPSCAEIQRGVSQGCRHRHIRKLTLERRCRGHKGCVRSFMTETSCIPSTSCRACSLTDCAKYRDQLNPMDSAPTHG